MLLTTASEVPAGGRLTELRVVQPMAGGRVELVQRWLWLQGMVNLEGLTLRNGELAPGNWGEGFVDRRHPHTYIHELMVQAAEQVGPVRVGAGMGKGFASFGTDDPMSRPAVRYPVNHHWAQILERLVIVGQLGLGPLTLEGSLFNGDEPERPSQWPNQSRFGDSWAARVLLAPGAGLELQGSVAEVHSPEHRPGAGLDQTKWSGSVRLERSLAGGPGYALAEWARTDDAGGVFHFSSVLVEGAIRLGSIRPYYRFERTERPEEERLTPYRSPRPHIEDALLGTSRWTVHTIGAARSGFHPGPVALDPLAELSLGRIAKVGPGVFQVRDWYQRPTFWTLSVGFRLHHQRADHRMGRYGVLQPQAHSGIAH